MWFDGATANFSSLSRNSFDNVLKCRHILGDELFIDKLLKDAGFKNPGIYANGRVNASDINRIFRIHSTCENFQRP
jgi:hypothetical protein